MLRVERHELGVRVHVWRWRWHHYTTGAALIAVGLRLVWVDRADWPWRCVTVLKPPVFDPVIGRTTTNSSEGW